MYWQTLTVLSAALACGSTTGFAQDGDLAGVTMRVLDDISALDAVILELDTDGGEEEKAAEGAAAPEAERATDPRDAAAQENGERPAAPPTPVP